MRIRWAFASLLAAAAIPCVVEGFSSVAGVVDNHRDITRTAITQLTAGTSPDPYPDLTMYAGWTYGRGAMPDYGIINGSADESAHSDPFSGVETWDSGHANWETKFRELYRDGHFDTAYNKIGFFIHLVEDDFSPPHKYTVFHGPTQWDGFEFFLTPSRSIPTSDPGFSGAHGLRYPFTSTMYDTLQYRPAPMVITSWEFVNVPEGRRFWLRDNEDDDDEDETTADVNDATQSDGPNSYQITAGWGSYGGQYSANDRIPGNQNENGDWFDLQEVRPTAENIIAQQLWEAKEETKRQLKRISEKLPPLSKGFLVKGGEEEFPRIDKENGTPIVFEIYENRTPEVFVTLEIIGHGAIKDADGTVWKRRPVTVAASTSTNLPFVKKVELTWKGELEDGKFLHDQRSSAGRYRLLLTLEDRDGNRTGPRTVAFEDRGSSVFSYYTWDVEVENARPYARSLDVSQGTRLVYSAVWEDGEGRRALTGVEESLAIRLTRDPDPGPLRFKVTFNNAMKSVTLKVEDVPVAMQARVARNPVAWEGTCPVDSLRKYRTATELRVTIEGTDTDDAVLDSRPDSIAVYNSDAKRWEQYEPGPDRWHKLKVDPAGPPVAQSVEIRQGGNTVYQGRWHRNGETRALSVSREDLGESGAAEITVEFSDEVKADTVSVQVGKTAAAKKSFQDGRWMGTFDPKAAAAGLKEDESIVVTLRAQNEGGLALDADPTTVAAFDAARRWWNRYENNRRGQDTHSGGDDTWHEFGVIGDSWVIVLDASGSMAEDNRIQKAKEAIKTALKAFGKNDEVALIVFFDCGSIRVMHEFTRDKEKIIKVVDGIHPSGGTPLFAAAKFAQEYLDMYGRGKKKHAPLVFTDGKETCGGRPLPKPVKVIKLGEKPPPPPAKKHECKPQQWVGYHAQRSGSADVTLQVTRYVEKEDGGACSATLTVEIFMVTYGKVVHPGGREVKSWRVNSRPSSRHAETKSDPDAIKALRDSAQKAREVMITRESAYQQIEGFVRELLK